VRFGLLPTEKVIPLLFGLERGTFEKHRVTVEIDIVDSAAERDDRFLDGGYDIALMNMVSLPPIFHRAPGARCLTVIERTAPHHPMFTLLECPSGQTGEIATSLGSIAEYVACGLGAEVFGLDGFEVREIASIPARAEALVRSEVGCAVLPEPMASACVRAGCAALADDRVIRMPPPLFVAASSAVASKEGELRRFRTAYEESVRLATANRHEAVSIARSVGLPYECTDDLPDFPEWEAPLVADAAVTLEWWSTWKREDHGWPDPSAFVEQIVWRPGHG
jgi:ABC-type nitrate/sulfonate/bicarbonate transport system substrate-binding protein